MKLANSRFTVRRLVLDAVLVALYVLLGFLKIPIGNMLRINLASFAVTVCAVAFSPIDGLIVGFMGEFLSQILGPYGMTPTTALWALPEAVRGLLLGVFMLIFVKKQLTADRLLKSKAIVWYPIGKFPLKKGVYETRVLLNGKTYKGITNYGARPTFDNETITTETYLDGFDGDLYGKILTVQFIKYLRDVKKFDSVDDLKEQLQKDIRRVRDND